MAYIQIALLALKLIEGLVNWARENQLISAGEDKAIAQASAAILTQTQSAKAVMEEVSGMSGSALDVLLHQLEPGTDK